MADPTTVSGVAYRWRASTLGLSNGAAVSSWTDSVGSVALVQATGTAQPTYVTGAANGQPVVRFDGTTDFLTTTTASQAQPVTGVIIHKVNVLPASSGVIYQMLDMGSQMVLLNNAGTQIYDSIAGGTDQAAGTPNTTAYRCYAFVNNGSSSNVWLDGTQIITNGAAGSIGNTGAVAVGRQQSTAARFFNGDIAEILVYNAALSTADMAVVDTYAQDTYGITVADYVAATNIPTGLTATVISATEIDLAWNAVPGAVGYDLMRNGALLATGVAGLSYNDTGLTGSTAYTYNVRSVF